MSDLIQIIERADPLSLAPGVTYADFIEDLKGPRRKAPNFAAAVKKLPPQVAFVHHGRDPAAGLDCLGLALSIYRAAGTPQDELDQPYGLRDMARRHRTELLRAKLVSRFRPVPGPYEDGDLALLERGHLGVIVGGHVYQMTAQGLALNPVRKMQPWFRAVYRHRDWS